jgi:hypothetical protein
VPQHKVTGDKACRSTDLLLAVKGVEQSSADLLGLGRQVIEPLAAFAGQQGWWHIRVSGEIDRHSAVEVSSCDSAAHRAQTWGGATSQRERSMITPSQLAPLLYRFFVETEPTPMVAVPDWSQLPEVTRQRWLQMATLLNNRLQTLENSKKAQSQ